MDAHEKSQDERLTELTDMILNGQTPKDEFFNQEVEVIGHLHQMFQANLPLDKKEEIAENVLEIWEQEQPAPTSNIIPFMMSATTLRAAAAVLMVVLIGAIINVVGSNADPASSTGSVVGDPRFEAFTIIGVVFFFGVLYYIWQIYHQDS